MNEQLTIRLDIDTESENCKNRRQGSSHVGPLHPRDALTKQATKQWMVTHLVQCALCCANRHTVKHAVAAYRGYWVGC